MGSLTERRLKIAAKDVRFWIGCALMLAAVAAPFFGRWDIGTFFLVWACWLDLKLYGSDL